MFHTMLVKGLVENGWPLRNPLLGAPGTSELYDFPEASNLDLGLMKLVALASKDYATVLNTFFLLTFPLTVVTSLYALRQLRISYPSAIVGSLLYSFLPYHFLRGESHLFLAAYYVAPLIVVVAVWILRPDGGPKHERFGWPAAKVAAGIGIALAVASSFIYYAVFGAFIIAIAGLLAVRLQDRRVRRARMTLAACLAGLIAFTYLLNVSPSLLYIVQHGRNRVMSVRDPAEAQIYGLKIATLFLPIAHHRVHLLASIRARYDEGAPLTNENGMASLGAVGAIGFLLLLTNLTLGIPEGQDKAMLHNLASLNLACVLLGTLGGLGTLASHVLPLLRSYNRISIFIGFFSLAAVMMVLDRLSAWLRERRGGWVVYPVLATLVLAGVWDQTSPSYVPDYAALRAVDASDAAFVGRLEASSPLHAMIFQLPYMQFPEPLGDFPPTLETYTHLRGYLHSRTLRWSYGAMKGRAVDAWQKTVASQPMGELVAAVRAAGFSGIYVDRNGYADGGRTVMAALSEALRTTPLVSPNGRLVYFPL
ncbi:MAG TPA: hypothetical protein VJT33_15075 [bacterium]|nr:hypothetical protein [bacterium]